MNVIGIDGCRAGWFYVLFQEPSKFKIGVFDHISNVTPYLSENTLILIDIPIGLTDSPQGRKCDQKARKVLSPLRHSSVFSAPCRKAIQQSSYENGSTVNFEITGRKLSKQSWGISSKIKEVDDFLQSLDLSARQMIREIHPEVAFWSLNNKQPMAFNKKINEGFEERRLLLKGYSDQAEEIFDKALKNFRRNQVARDDISDAFVGAITALMNKQILTLPEEPELDAHGLVLRKN